jgi:hypothetical protein
VLAHLLASRTRCGRSPELLQQNQLDVPPWLRDEAEAVLCARLSSAKRGKRGRASNPVARYRQDMIDFERWDAVREAREKQTEIRQQVEELSAMLRPPASLLREREKMLHWVGDDWLRAYECAAMILSGTAASGGPDAMKASYLRVNRNSRDPDQPLRYHLFTSGISARLQLSPPTKFGGGKIVPLYELTL